MSKAFESIACWIAAVSPTPLKPMKRVLPAFCSFSQRRHDLVQGDLDREMVAGILGDQRIVQLEEVDVIAPRRFRLSSMLPLDRLADVGRGRLAASRTLVPSTTSGFSALSTRPRLRSDSPLP